MKNLILKKQDQPTMSRSIINNNGNSKHLMGYDSLTDFFNTNLGFSSLKFNSLMAIILSISGFITNYIYDSYQAVYFMVFLLMIDSITGIWKAIKKGIFSSRKMPRVLLTMVFYVLLLSISWNAAKYSDLFNWLPGLMYGGLISTSMVSIMENIHELGFLPNSIYTILKQRLKIKSWFEKNEKK